MNICIIPARGGSKRIPRKNIREFNGKPIIGWSIDAAKRARCIDIVVVSTDDSEIASVAKSFGAEVPFIRPNNLADDFTGTIPVIQHAIEWHLSKNYNISTVCCLYATAPFVDHQLLEEGYQKLQSNHANNYTFAACSYSSPIQRAFRINKITGHAKMLDSMNYNCRTQDFEATYHDAGQFYWGHVDTWKSSKNLIDGSHSLVLPQWRAQDIDNEDDWIRAEIIHKSIFP